MTTLTHNPTGWHGTDTAANAPDTVQLRIAVQTALDAVTGANGDTLAAAETRLTTAESDIVDLTRAHYVRVPLTLTADATWATYVELPKAGTATAFSVTTPTVFASTGGTVLLHVKKTSSAGNTMINAATYDLEGVSANTRTALTLTATTGDRGIADTGLIYVSVVANNADATGPAAGAAILTVQYSLTV